jgi:hypothetical protein
MIKCPNCDSQKYSFIPAGITIGKEVFYNECGACGAKFNESKSFQRAKGGRRVLME